ncbi:MAG TPA: DUF6044 family protein [Humidesulfovibrio sp.]|uniref:DUF6044 family protein n=1 Tax=Humidesulfovibrio sp. TaxID=2910988 RepID=UPI002B596BCA|nr:DUF6044 family protein [Humidesulfovibrio sp.]HWR03993.1 DUF6044 family protein [Humidesulfovibrio sp.]
MLLAGTLPLWTLSLLWNCGQMFLAGYGLYRFLPLLLGTSRRMALLVASLVSLTWISGNVHFVMSYAFPAVFVWCVELFRRGSTRRTKLKAASLIALMSLLSFPVLTLPHFPVLHLALVLLLGRHLPDFRRQVAGVFLIWTAYVLLYLPSIASLFLYIPYTQREWDFRYPGLLMALVDFFSWLRGRLADQQLIALLLLGLPFLSRRNLRISYAFLLAMLVVAGVFTSDLKGLFQGSFLLKMDLFMFANCLGIVSAIIVAQVLEVLAVSGKRTHWYWGIGVVALLPLFGAAHKVLVYICIFGAALAGVALMRISMQSGAPVRDKSGRRWAIALVVCLAAAAMLVRQQNMTSGMFAPYAQGMLGHKDLSQLAATGAKEPFRVACVDVHPAVAQNLGLDTVGGKSPLFNKYYKELVREAIRPQFSKPSQLQAFDNLWRQLYLTRLQIDLDQRSWVLDKAPTRSVADFNWDALRAMNVTHVIASREMAGMDAVAESHTISAGYGDETPLLARFGGPFGNKLRDRYSLPLHIYTLKDTLPRVYLATPQIQETRDEALQALAQSDMTALHRRVFVAREDMGEGAAEWLGLQPETQPGAAPLGEVRISSWSPDRIVMEGTAARPCVLVAANNFDPHWTAIGPDGLKIQSFRVNNAWQGYAIEQPGPFHLELTYSNPLIWRLNLASLLGLGLMFIGVLWGRGQETSLAAAPDAQPFGLIHLSWRTALLSGCAAALVWALAFGLFIMNKHKGPQAESFAYALATIPALGVLVACWTRNLLRRF